jgi:hypothetical protein
MALSLGGCHDAATVRYDIPSTRNAQVDAGRSQLAATDAEGDPTHDRTDDAVLTGKPTQAADAGGGAAIANDAGNAGDVEAGLDAGTDDVCVEREPLVPADDGCHSLDGLVLENPRIVDDSGDGVLSPGEHATLVVTWRETKGIGASWYPGVRFTSTSRSVVVGADDQRYAALACHAEDLHTELSIVPDAALHTRIDVTAQVIMIGRECPLGASLAITFSVGGPLP